MKTLTLIASIVSLPLLALAFHDVMIKLAGKIGAGVYLLACWLKRTEPKP